MPPEACRGHFPTSINPSALACHRLHFPSNLLLASPRVQVVVVAGRCRRPWCRACSRCGCTSCTWAAACRSICPLTTTSTRCPSSSSSTKDTNTGQSVTTTFPTTACRTIASDPLQDPSLLTKKVILIDSLVGVRQGPSHSPVEGSRGPSARPVPSPAPAARGRPPGRAAALGRRRTLDRHAGGEAQQVG